MAASREEAALGARAGNFYTALALDAMQEPILIVDCQDGRYNVILANAASRRRLHHPHAPLLGSSALEFLEFASRQPFLEAIGRLKGGSAAESVHIAWLGPDFDADCATEFKLLTDPGADARVMLTLPAVDAASRRFREISEIQQLSHLLGDGEGIPKIGGWEQRADSDRLSRTDGMYRLFEADPAEFLQDVTNRRSTQARVSEYGELLRTATANTTDVLLLLDADLKVRFCNRSIRGMTPQAMMGLPAERVMDQSGWAEHMALLGSVLTTGTTVSFSCEAVGEDGDTHRYENRAIPLFDKGLISGVSVTITDITERMRLEREILEISTREQERIGQDLHDGLGQELTGVALMLRSLSTKIRRDYPNATDDVDDIIAMVNRSIDTARSLARGLSPLNAERGGLVHALRSLAARSRDIYGLNARFRSKIWPQLTLDETRCSHLYRIAQEALTNIARHANATRADVRLQVTDNKFALTISDDGVGLDGSFKSSSGMGLKLMAYRAGMIGGKLEIGPNEPKGTIVRISGEQPPLM